MEINNLPDNEFKIRIIKKLNKLGRKVHEYSDKFNKDLGNIKKNQRASQVELVVKNPSASAGGVRDVGLIPGSGRSPGRGHGNPLQYSRLENPTDRRDS